LAGVAGVILVMTIGSVTPTMGQIPILVAFVATVIGGMRSLLGAVLGALLLALCTTVPETLLTGSAQQFTDSFVYGGVFLLLLFLPNGLLSPNRRMRVV
jgi:branched-chain amino acid transport system permease protein